MSAVLKAAVRCAIYARFSTDKQPDTSSAAQILACRKEAAKRGWEISETDICTDEGISDAAMGNRPQFQLILEAANRRAYGVLFVNDLTRLAPSQDCALGEHLLELARLRRKGPAKPQLTAVGE